MFNSLQGRITFKGDNLLFLGTQGIEWEIATTAQTLAALPPVDEEAKVYTHLIHREDQMRLYGFATPAERLLFLELIKIEGVGPKLAQKILSTVEQNDFLAMVAKEDSSALEALPGLGKKTVQKIILHLKDKLPTDLETEMALAGWQTDLINALVGMGFEKKASREAVLKVVSELGAKSLDHLSREQEIFKSALSLLSRNGKAK